MQFYFLAWKRKINVFFFEDTFLSFYVVFFFGLILYAIIFFYGIYRLLLSMCTYFRLIGIIHCL